MVYELVVQMSLIIHPVLLLFFLKNCTSCLHWAWFYNSIESYDRLHVLPCSWTLTPSMWLAWTNSVYFNNRDWAKAWNVVTWLGLSLHASAFAMRRIFSISVTWVQGRWESSGADLSQPKPHCQSHLAGFPVTPIHVCMPDNKLLLRLISFMTIGFIVSFLVGAYWYSIQNTYIMYI